MNRRGGRWPDGLGEAAPLPAGQGKVLRICLDLNVYCAYLLGLRKGHTETASQALIHAVRQGSSALGPVQLVISWGMLNRLQQVWQDGWRIPAAEAEPLLAVIAGFAVLGPDGEPPHLILGGTGLIPLRDTEDAHVLDVAVAGRADLLVTSNFSDFLGYRTEIREAGRLAIHHTPGHSVVIAHLYTAAQWLRDGRIVIP